MKRTIAILLLELVATGSVLAQRRNTTSASASVHIINHEQSLSVELQLQPNPLPMTSSTEPVTGPSIIAVIKRSGNSNSTTVDALKSQPGLFFTVALPAIVLIRSRSGQQESLNVGSLSAFPAISGTDTECSVPTFDDNGVLSIPPASAGIPQGDYTGEIGITLEYN